MSEYSDCRQAQQCRPEQRVHVRQPAHCIEYPASYQDGNHGDIGGGTWEYASDSDDKEAGYRDAKYVTERAKNVWDRKGVSCYYGTDYLHAVLKDRDVYCLVAVYSTCDNGCLGIDVCIVEPLVVTVSLVKDVAYHVDCCVVWVAALVYCESNDVVCLGGAVPLDVPGPRRTLPVNGNCYRVYVDAFCRCVVCADVSDKGRCSRITVCDFHAVTLSKEIALL